MYGDCWDTLYNAIILCFILCLLHDHWPFGSTNDPTAQHSKKKKKKEKDTNVMKTCYALVIYWTLQINDKLILAKQFFEPFSILNCGVFFNMCCAWSFLLHESAYIHTIATFISTPLFFTLSSTLPSQNRRNVRSICQNILFTHRQQTPPSLIP